MAQKNRGQGVFQDDREQIRDHAELKRHGRRSKKEWVDGIDSPQDKATANFNHWIGRRKKRLLERFHSSAGNIQLEK